MANRFVCVSYTTMTQQTNQGKHIIEEYVITENVIYLKAPVKQLAQILHSIHNIRIANICSTYIQFFVYLVKCPSLITYI